LIDFILGKTKVQKLTYIGHSQGTSQMFCGLSVLPEFFEKRVNAFLAVAPVATLNKIESPVISKFAYSEFFIDKTCEMAY
jgi:pimeloyl-ACP methyl ester carboxylesterase